MYNLQPDIAKNKLTNKKPNRLASRHTFAPKLPQGGAQKC